jgi:hypothetical protein
MMDENRDHYASALAFASLHGAAPKLCYKLLSVHP